MLLSAARSPCERRTGPRRPPGPELEALPREGRRERPAGPALRASPLPASHSQSKRCQGRAVPMAIEGWQCCQGP
jgi:hypothetical protein